MKINITYFTVALLLQCGFLWGKSFNDFAPKNYWLGISTEVPPALMWVVDSNGHRAGADPALPVDQYGLQGDDLHGLEEIPASVTDQQNLENDNTGQSQKNTLWSVSIPDGGRADYTVNLKGIKSDVCNLGIDVGSNGFNFKNTNNYIDVFVTPNVTRQIKVSFDPSQLTANVQRIVSKDDLLNDIKVACQKNLVTSSHACKEFEKKAKAIQDALEDHHYEKAEELIWSFRHMLGESRPGGCKEDDHHVAVKEPALTIFKEDAKALLAQLEEKQHHRDQHGEKGK